MKVGILTHHWLYNFGANLQALATQRCLQSIGHEPIIINYRPVELVRKYDSLVSAEQIDAHCGFRDQHLVETEICSNVDEVIAAATTAGVDTMLSGSDAVLRINATVEREDLNFPNPFWLEWAVERGMRTGFLAASSMGTNYLSLPAKTRSRVGELLRKLDYIGVRDNWTKLMLSICSRKAKIEYCPDPVSVFNDVVPSALYPSNSDEEYILVSLYENTIPTTWVREFVKIANDKGLKVFSLPHPELQLEGPFDRVLPLPMSPLQWYSWIKHAKAYVGVRFHPIMISLVNHVPFVALDQYESNLSFRSRTLTRAASLVTYPWRRHTSKTYDLARRAGKIEYCLNRRMYRKRSPNEIFQLLEQQWHNPVDTEFAEIVKKNFTSALKRVTSG